jgi:hypothetical protein
MAFQAPLAERIERLSIPEPNTGCLLWLGTLSPHGYGRIKIKGRPRFAYKIAWELENGPVPKGLVLDHRCNQKQCVNTAHLKPVTNKENVLRGTSPMAANAMKTHCRLGHEISSARNGEGKRRCRICQRASNLVSLRKWRAGRAGGNS